jgi:hypothetical protein
MSDDSPVAVALDFALAATFDGSDLNVSAVLAADATVNLPGITVIVEDIELAVGIELGDQNGELAFTASLTPSPPHGASATVNLPALRGEGDLVFSDDHKTCSGALLLQLLTFSVDAFAVIEAGDDDLSFVVVLCARFPQPGIQVGFGFAVTGVGGVFGLNRRSDTDALTAAVLDGSLAGLLFPNNAKDDAGRIVKNLPALFPASRGQLLVGPMLEVTWAGGLLTAEVMVLLELPDPLRVTVLGRLTVDLPTGDAAIVHIEARILASVTPSIPEFRLVASLTGSTIATFPLTGDLFLLIRGGPEATFVFSAGGFHPAATPPPNVPPLKRLGMTMSLSIIELRCESYLAVTTSSVQTGASVELTALIDECGIHGNFGFDALIEWEPRFHLRVDVHIGLTVEVFGEHLCGVSFDGSLAGPGPWQLNGRGEVELLFVSVAIPIDATFGSTPKPLVNMPVVGKLLTQELAKPSSWTAHPPATLGTAISLGVTARADLAAGTALHPGGSLEVTQHLVPLELTIDRFGGYSVPAQCWTITGVGIGVDSVITAPAKTYDTFADGTFTTLTVDQQLTTNGFTAHPAGAEIIASGFNAGPPAAPVTLDVQDIPIDLPTPSAPSTNWALQNTLGLIPLKAGAVAVAVAANPVSVSAQPPLAAATQAPMPGRLVLELWETL